MRKEEELAIYKAINNVSKKVNDIESKMDEIMQRLHIENANRITDNENGVLDIADSVSAHDEAIMELAQLISDLETESTESTKSESEE